MRRPDAEIAAKVRQWLTYADEDLRLANHALTLITGAPYRLIAYHAQQGAEKCLKAYLVFHESDFPYTHNILRLLEICAEYGDWPRTIEAAEELTPYAITARYPGEDEPVTKDEAVRAIAIAEELREKIKAALLKEGLSNPEKAGHE